MPAPTIRSLKFHDYKTFSVFEISCRQKNVLVGPNNSGKSTALDALRILYTVIRYCRRTNGRMKTQNSEGVVPTYWIPQTSFDIDLGVCVKDFRDQTKAKIAVTLTNGSCLTMVIDPDGPLEAYLTANQNPAISTDYFKRNFPLDIVIVPTLSPFEQSEPFVLEKTASRNEFTRLGSRNFRNVWLYKTDAEFEQLADLVAGAWNGIRLYRPEILGLGKNRTLQMQFRDGSKVREVQWSGFGFQVWMQTMAHLLRCDHNTIFVLDEPDVYLHPDLQHRLVKNISQRVGQIFIATHSSEIINEVEPGDVVMVRNGARSGKRVKSEADYGQLFGLIGSSENAQFARLARTKKVLYFEGQDRKILRKIGNKVGFPDIFDDAETTFMKTDGFQNWERVSTTAWVFRNLFDFDVRVAAIFDRDYRCDEEIAEFEEKFVSGGLFCRVLPFKEIENVLLHPSAIERAVMRLVDETQFPDWRQLVEAEMETQILKQKGTVSSSRIGERTRFVHKSSRNYDPTTLAIEEGRSFETLWGIPENRRMMVPGKEVFAGICSGLRERIAVSLTAHKVASEMDMSFVPFEFRNILSGLQAFMAESP